MAKIKKDEIKKVVESLGFLLSQELFNMANDKLLFAEIQREEKKSEYNISTTKVDKSDRAKYLGTIVPGVIISPMAVDIVHTDFAGAVPVDIEEYLSIYGIPCPDVLKDKDFYIIKSDNIISYSHTTVKNMNLNE